MHSQIQVPGSGPAARGKLSEALSDDGEQMVSVWNAVGLRRLLPDIQSQARVVPSSLAPRTLARTTLGGGGGEVACCHRRHVFLQCSGDSAGPGTAATSSPTPALPPPHAPPLRTRPELEVEARHLPAPSPFPALAISGQCAGTLALVVT